MSTLVPVFSDAESADAGRRVRVEPKVHCLDPRPDDRRGEQRVQLAHLYQNAESGTDLVCTWDGDVQFGTDSSGISVQYRSTAYQLAIRMMFFDYEDAVAGTNTDQNQEQGTTQ